MKYQWQGTFCIMHIHHYTLTKIADLIRKEVGNGILVEAFSQDRDQLVLGLATPEKELYLRVACAAPLPFIWPVRQYHKAKRNVKNLFEDIYGLHFTKVETLAYERVILIHFEKNYMLALKMHGLVSNVFLFKNGKLKDRFRHNREADLEYKPMAGDFDAEWAVKLADSEGEDTPARLKGISRIYGKNFAARIDHLMSQNYDFGKAFEQSIVDAEDGRYFLVKRPNRIQFLLFDPEVPDTMEFDNFEKALQAFFRLWFQYGGYARQYAAVKKPLAKHLKRYKGQVDSFYKSIDSIEKARPSEEIGHILMANLHQVEAGLKEVELYDFYLEKPIKIKLKAELNAQQNAQKYYQKQKKNKSRMKHLEVQIERLEGEMEAFLEIKKEFDQFPEPQTLEITAEGADFAVTKAMNIFSKAHQALLSSGKPKLADKKHPFKEFKKLGYTIYVGKNSKQNDKLTFQFSKKKDIWMHARSVQGSHVIVQNPSGQDLPKPVLEYAAGLAAHHSKRKNEQLVPVQYAPRKYVRKVRNGAPGQVIVEREKVVMVEPVAE